MLKISIFTHMPFIGITPLFIHESVQVVQLVIAAESQGSMFDCCQGLYCSCIFQYHHFQRRHIRRISNEIPRETRV
jgi:hypothetical protein